MNSSCPFFGLLLGIFPTQKWRRFEGNKNVIHARDQEIKNLKETVNDLKKQLLSEDDGIEVLNGNKS